MLYETGSKNRGAPSSPNSPVSTGIPFWDMMLQMQRASSQALSSFVPLASYGGQASTARFEERSKAPAAQRTTNSVEVLPVGEETFHVGTHTVQGETTRLRRVVVETPVEQQVSLRTETVVVERRKPTTTTPSGDILSEKSVEMTDSFQVADTWKSVHLREEVVLRTEITEHVETVRDIVRRDEVKVEHPTVGTSREISVSKYDNKAPGVQAVAKQIAENIKTARPAAEVQLQDAVPPAAVKAEADRGSSTRPGSETQPQENKFAAPQNDHKPGNGSVAGATSDTKPGAPPRADAGQSDKGSAGPGRR